MANNNDDDQKQIAELINFTVESAAAQLESKMTNDFEKQKTIYLQEETTTTNDEDIAISTVTESDTDTENNRNEPLLNNYNECEQFTDVRLSMNDSKKEDKMADILKKNKTDGWICTGKWFDCGDWNPVTYAFCIGTMICCFCIPVVPLCTKCGTRSNEARDLTKINAETNNRSSQSVHTEQPNSI